MGVQREQLWLYKGHLMFSVYLGGTVADFEVCGSVSGVKTSWVL